jgi:hypothetical protein
VSSLLYWRVVNLDQLVEEDVICFFYILILD